MLVFISHSSKDCAFVEEQLCPFLHDQGVSTWYSNADIKTAVDWERGIRSGLKASEYFLVVLSPNALQSDWVRAEVLWAMKNRKGKVVPVMLSPCDPIDIHLQLPLIQNVDLSSNNHEQWQALAATWPNEPGTFKKGNTSFTFLGCIEEGHQVFLFREMLMLTTWNGSDFGPIDMFKTPINNPVISSLQECQEMHGDGEELFTIPEDAGWSVRFYRIDFRNKDECSFDNDILTTINGGEFYVVPLQEPAYPIFGATTMTKPLLTAILAHTHSGGELSLLVAISPGSV